MFAYSGGKMSEMNWLPLAEYAVAKGISISTVRRKIKSDAVKYKMENGRYLIASTVNKPKERAVFAYSSDDTTPTNRPDLIAKPDNKQDPAFANTRTSAVKNTVTRDTSKGDTETESSFNEVRWRALEARITGLAKKVEYLSEQNSELKMLVKIFEEKLNATL